MSDITPEQVHALGPIVTRVRRDRTAILIRMPDGKKIANWVDEPLNVEAVGRHLNGGPARGASPIKPGESVTMLALIDLDSHDGATEWGEMVRVGGVVADAMGSAGMPVTAFRSTGGRGLHLYTIWDAPQDAYSVRQAISGVLASVGLSVGTKGVVYGEAEVFPKQDSVDIGRDGNMFFLPLAGKSVPLDLLFGEPIATGDVQWQSARPVVRLERPERTQSTSRFAPIASIRSALAAIPNESRADGVDYETWRDLMFAVYDGSGGSEEGFQAGLEFSIRNKDIVEEHGGVEGVERFLRERLWQYVETGKGVTVGTLFMRAGERSGGTWAPPIDISDFVDQTTGEISDAAVVGQMGVEVLPPLMEVDPRTKTTAALGLVDKTRLSFDAKQRWKTAIEGVKTELDLREKVCSGIAADYDLQFVDRESLIQPIIKAFAVFDTRYNTPSVRELITPKRTFNPQKKQMTEFGNAERMVDRHLDKLIYVPEIAKWFVWNGVTWDRATDKQIEIYAKDTVMRLAEEVAHYDDPTEFYEFCRMSQRAQMVKSMISLAASDTRIMVPAKELDRHTHYLGVANGVVDLRTGELLRADPKLYITMSTECDYDPNARAPLFEQTIKDVFFDDMQMVEYVMRTFGYALMGNPIEDIMFIAFGEGSNGKSTIFNAVRQTFGSYAKVADANTFVSNDPKGGNAGGPREDLIVLRGARFVYVNEPDEGGELREGTVKSMTGGDVIRARAPFAPDSIEITPSWVVFMPTNHKPVIKGSDNGIWRRIGLTPFERNFDKDLTIKKELGRKARVAAERVGILSLLVKAALRYQQMGLAAPPKVDDARKEYRSDMDLLSEWIDERCDISDPSATCEMRVLWLSWESYAKELGLINYIKTVSLLSRRLESRFKSAKLPGGARVKRGIKLKTDLFQDVL